MLLAKTKEFVPKKDEKYNVFAINCKNVSVCA